MSISIMLKRLLIICVGIGCVLSQNQKYSNQPNPIVPVGHRDTDESRTYKPKIYEVRSQITPNIGDGNFQYYVETSDGLQAEQVGYIRKPEASQVHQGSYTTFDDNGKVVLINYIADKDGFRVVSGDLPTSPPIPEEQVKAREAILKQQQDIRQQHLTHFRAAHAAHGRQF